MADPWEGEEKHSPQSGTRPATEVSVLLPAIPLGATSNAGPYRLWDNTPPEVTIEAPDQFVRVNTSVLQEFIASAYDPDRNFASWEWYVNGVRQGGEDPIPDNRFPTFYHVRAAASFSTPSQARTATR